MAITLGDAVLFFRGDDKGLDQDLGKAEQKTKGWASGLGGALKTALGGAILGGITAVTAAVVGIGVASVDVSSQIHQATNDIQAQLGETEEAAERLGGVAVNVFKNNFGDSIGDATAALITARQQLGQLADDELQDATENAFRLRDAFGVDVADSLSAVRTLTQEFGLSQQEAFDLITTGYQRGLDASGDFLDSIGEYSTQFAEGGATADQFFSVLQSGLSGGMLGTDKAADAFKEFRVRIQDGSKLTAESLALIGIDADKLAQQMADGSVTATDAFQMVLGKLREVDDQNILMQAGVGLLGTQFEDLGQDAVLALSTTITKMDEFAGATDKLDVQYQNLGALVEGFKRNFLVALQPIGDKLLEIGNQIMPQVQAAFDWMAAELPGIIDQVAAGIDEWIGFLQSTALPILQAWGEWFFNEGLPALIAFITPIIEQVVPGLQLLAEISLNLGQAVMPILSQAFTFLAENSDIVIPILAALGVAILALTSPITLIAGLIVALATAWANDWGGIQTKTEEAVGFIQGIIGAGMAAIQEIVGPALAYLSQWWADHGDNLMTIVKFVWDYIVNQIQAAIKNAQVIIMTIGEAIRAFWDAWGKTLMELARLAWDSIVTIVKTAMDLIGFIIDAIASAIRGDWSAFGEALRGIWNTIWNAIVTIVTNQAQAAWLVISNLITQVTGPWNTFVNGIKTAWQTAWNGVVTTINNQVAVITGAVNNIINQVKGAWESFVGGLQSAWENTWNNIVDFIEGIVDSIVGPIQDIINAIEDLLDIDLPSFPGWPGFGGGGLLSGLGQNITNNNLSLTLNTRAEAGSLVGEYQALQALIGT